MKNKKDVTTLAIGGGHTAENELPNVHKNQVNAFIRDKLTGRSSLRHASIQQILGGQAVCFGVYSMMDSIFLFIRISFALEEVADTILFFGISFFQSPRFSALHVSVHRGCLCWTSAVCLHKCTTVYFFQHRRPPTREFFLDESKIDRFLILISSWYNI